jgi:hypothetical protein
MNRLGVISDSFCVRFYRGDGGLKFWDGGRSYRMGYHSHNFFSARKDLINQSEIKQFKRPYGAALAEDRAIKILLPTGTRGALQTARPPSITFRGALKRVRIGAPPDKAEARIRREIQGGGGG